MIHTSSVVVFPTPGYSPPIPDGSPIPGNVGIPLTDMERAVIASTNRERAQRSIAPLVIHPQLVTAAQIHAENMARLDQMSHILNETSTPSPVDRLVLVGYPYQTAGENIAYNFRNSEDVIAGWLASPGHRANMLNPVYTDTGVAIRPNKFGELYYCHVFGRSSQSPPQPVRRGLIDVGTLASDGALQCGLFQPGETILFRMRLAKKRTLVIDANLSIGWIALLKRWPGETRDQITPDLIVAAGESVPFQAQMTKGCNYLAATVTQPGRLLLTCRLVR